LKGLAIAVLFHGLYDFFLFYAPYIKQQFPSINKYFGFAIFSIITLYYALRLSFRAINDLQNESPFSKWKFKKFE